MGDFYPPESAPSDLVKHLSVDEDVVLNLWGKWEIHSMVLLSFSLQVVLFVSAGFRRRSANTTLRVFIWLAYLLADSVATYTLGHLFVTTIGGVQQLQAFWAPFLLLHLGGQDTITAYALEDNRLWLRHLQALGVQVLAAVFVLIGFFVSGGWALGIAGALMFLVGSLKYGERIWALKCAGNDGMYSFLIRHCKQQPATETMELQLIEHERHLRAGRAIFQKLHTDEERVTHGAHSLLGISLCMFLDNEKETCRHNNEALPVLAYLVTDGDREIYRVIEMQLCLMYDIMYTKARVIHTWYGLCIRVISLVAIAATVILMLPFLKTDDTVDAAVTYLLLVGALVMEIASGFIAIVSTWTRHGWIWNLAVYLRRLVKANWWRKWSGIIGQSNMIHSGVEAWCREVYGMSGLPLFQGKVSESRLPPPVQVSESMEISIRNEILSVVQRCRGAAEGMYTLSRNKKLLDDISEFDNKVIIWHIATHLILDSVSQQAGLQERIDETKMLSHYMMFLLTEHPDMLPGHTRHSLYTEALKYIQDLAPPQPANQRVLENGGLEQDENSTCLKAAALAHEMLAKTLKWEQTPAGFPRPDEVLSTSHTAATTRKLLAKADGLLPVEDTPASLPRSDGMLTVEYTLDSLLDELFGVWVEMLCYAGSHCSRDAHARSLSRGGEFLTVVWLLAGHFADYERFKRATPSPTRRASTANV